LRGPTSKERRAQRRGNKEEGGTEGKMEERGREGEKIGEEGGDGRNGSLHPLEFLKVGAYGYVSRAAAFSTDWSRRTK